MTVLKASEIWRDYETDEVPASGPHQPAKRDVRQWGSTLESMLAQLGLGFATKAALDVSLLYSANTLAMVYADSTAANNGIYVKSGTSGSGSWSRIGDLQISIIPLTVTGGTGNAIVATAPISPVNPAQHLYLLTPTANNTAATTIAINGGSAVAIKNALNANLASGSLIMGNAALMCWVTDHYQLLVAAAIDGNAILADAQAAAVSAASSASTATAAANATLNFATRTAAIAATIGGTVTHITTAGYSAIGDGGGSIATGAIYKRVGSLPGHSGYIQSADGAYWELTGPWVSVKQFGAVPVVSNLDTDPDAAAAINLCMAYCNLKHSNMLIPSGQWALDSAITSPTFIIRIDGEQGVGQPTIIYKRYVEANAHKGVISLGAWGAMLTNLQFAAKSGVSGGAAISAILPGNAANIGVLRLENIYVSGGDGYNNDWYIDGTANINAAGPSYRSVFANNCHFFGSAATPVYFVGVQHLFFTNFFVATTGGTVSSGNVMIIDGTTAAYSDDVHMHCGLISGSVNINNLHRATIMAQIDNNVVVAANSDKVTFLDVWGTKTLSGTNTRVLV
ncbi:hypothetical protein J4G43_030170 [Bradyrhizobium barranii subsp. barranii]|uniref:Uncharacterized protein n=1 Tax=Bradyrhizobium barranii subsp. barranii TaxID=2823807 RepID=A0A939MDH2_9BRAD|nr:hypothetical protein [Bradyrhizobium barranii]UEM09006.1 hypothetical protein J4G43_030170 [Bradyrhizobium barranii subsp. barranii]